MHIDYKSRISRHIYVTMVENFLKSFYCSTEDILVELWGCWEGWNNVVVTDIYILQNSRKTAFGGWKFHASDAVNAFRKAIVRMKDDTTLHETMVWMESEGRWEILMVRDGHEYRIGNVCNRSAYTNEDVYKDWIKIKNLDELESVLDSVEEYLNSSSSSEESSESDTEMC